MRVVAILQARMGSTRLKNKMLLPLCGKPMVQHVIERVRRATKLDFVVLAYPLHDNPAFKPILNSFVDTPGVPLGSWAGQGDENDLIQRYLGAATAYGADIIVRIPCDNACVQAEMIDAAVASYLARPQIYVSTMYWHPHDRVYADGLGAEVFSMSRLKWLDKATEGQASYREHPHLFFQDQHVIDGWEQYQRHANHRETIRLDVNTHADYEFIKDIYDHFGHNRFTASDILAYLEGKKVTA